MTDLFVFRLTQPEGDLIGKALGRLPFDEVYALIAKLQRQAQFEQGPPPPPPQNFGAGLPSPAADRMYPVEPNLPTPDRPQASAGWAPVAAAPSRDELDAKTAEWERTMAGQIRNPAPRMDLTAWEEEMIRDHINPIGVINGKEIERQPLRQEGDGHEGQGQEVEKGPRFRF